jgi:hypothetical protein
VGWRWHWTKGGGGRTKNRSGRDVKLSHTNVAWVCLADAKPMLGNRNHQRPRPSSVLAMVPIKQARLWETFESVETTNMRSH